MSLIPCPPLPGDTAGAATSLFGHGHPYIKAGDALDALWGNLQLSALQSSDAFLAASFHPCSPATIVQFWEHMTDRQMSQATRTRVDLKYALHLPLSYPGIEAATLCEFRRHIAASAAGRAALQDLMDRMNEFGNRDQSAANVNQVITAICLPSRAEMLLESMGIAIEAVATCDPNWLKANARPHWYRRYHRKLDNQKLPHDAAEIERFLEAIADDGRHLLQAIEKTDATLLARLPEIVALRRQWQRQFEWIQDNLKVRPFCNLAHENSLNTDAFDSNQRKGGYPPRP